MFKLKFYIESNQKLKIIANFWTQFLLNTKISLMSFKFFLFI
jgi:hypothetical protein